MKKILFLFGALSSLSCLAGPSIAGVPSQVKVMASVNGALVGAFQKQKDPADSEFALVGVGGNITAVISGKKGGSNFGMIAALDMDRLKEGTKRVAEIYGFLSNPYGNLFFGSFEGPAVTFMYDAGDVIGGSKSVGGYISRAIHLPVGAFLNAGFHILGPSNQIAFTTTSIHGFRFGVAFAPDTSELGRPFRTIEKGAVDKKFSYRNKVELALNFTKTLENSVTFGLYGAGVFARTMGAISGYDGVPAKYNPLKMFQAGMLLDFGSVRLAGGYFYAGKSAVREGFDHTAPKGLNFGIGCTVGPFLISGSCFFASRKVTGGDSTTGVGSVALDYAVAPGVTLYFEIDHVVAKSPEEHCAPGAVDPKLDCAWDAGGITTDHEGLNETKGTMFVVGMKIQC